MKNRVAWLIGIVLVVLIGIQAVPVQRTNPASQGGLSAPASVSGVFRRACYDCHSNETVWPWYSRVAPVSWLVSHDVAEGRQKLNFSRWQMLSADEQAKAKREALKEIERGDMPPWYYAAVHRDARLSAADRSALQAWLLAAEASGSHEP